MRRLFKARTASTINSTRLEIPSDIARGIFGVYMLAVKESQSKTVLQLIDTNESYSREYFVLHTQGSGLEISNF